jgi:hypothetical protein
MNIQLKHLLSEVIIPGKNGYIRENSKSVDFVYEDGSYARVWETDGKYYRSLFTPDSTKESGFKEESLGHIKIIP